jgi:8-oxo-(d)GTP phosphatase
VAALIRAAGGVLWRPGPLVCLVHRPRYDDWSLPKGKLDPGEHPLAAAVREVHEETAVRGAPQARLSSVRYKTRDGTPKAVDYWSMRVVSSASFSPNSEVDELSWLPPSSAAATASYPHDVRILNEFAALPPVTGVVLLIRHAYAGERSDWTGPDVARPLDPAGQARASGLASLLALFQPTRLVSASPRRCLQTLTPLASLVDLRVEVEAVFDEACDDPAGAASRLRSLAAESAVTVVCSQGVVIREALPLLVGRGTAKEYATPKGTGWLLPFGSGQVLTPDRLDGVS